MSSIYVGDNGTVFNITVSDDAGAVPLTTATSIVAHFVKADGSTFDKTLTVTSAVNGECTTSLTRDDLSVAGTYSFQVTVKFLDGSEFTGDSRRFTVKAKL